MIFILETALIVANMVIIVIQFKTIQKLKQRNYVQSKIISDLADRIPNSRPVK